MIGHIKTIPVPESAVVYFDPLPATVSDPLLPQ